MYIIYIDGELNNRRILNSLNPISIDATNCTCDNVRTYFNSFIKQTLSFEIAVMSIDFADFVTLELRNVAAYA